MPKMGFSENAFPYPMAMVVVGTIVEDRPNLMPVG
jgi:hypothetical protein